MRIQHFFGNLGWEGLLLGTAGLAAFILGMLDFTSLINLTNEPAVRIILSAVGLILGAVVAQSSVRRTEIESLKSAIGATEAEIITDSKLYGQHLYLHILNAKRFVSNTLLTASRSSGTPGYGFGGSQADAHRLIYKRVVNGEIEFRHVVMIYHRQILADTIFKLVLHEGFKFYVRCYEAPPKPIPILNITSFDDETFFIGNYHTTVPAGHSLRLFIREPHLSQVLQSYWQVNWEAAFPLNEGRSIKWDELKRIAQNLGMTEADFETLVTQLKGEVQSIKRKLLR